MKKIIFALAIISVFAIGKVNAQNYNWALGVRGGVLTTGITGKYNLDPANSIEAMIDFTRGINVYGLYERNIPVIGSGFNFYYGAGANIGGWKRHGYSKFTMGIDGIAGLEYKIQTIPLALSVDYKPCLNFIGHTGFRASDVGLTVKITF